MLATVLFAAAIEVPVVVVTATRTEHASFDVPASIDAVKVDENNLRTNASEALAAVPGLVVQNRQNYAQDLQISSRGFGARSAFGVRGVHLLTDGIPASMPDGQGQAATFNLDMAERIEVLRGPYSAIYGNHAGGVIQLFTKEGDGAPSVELNVAGGSYGTRKTDLNAQGKQGNVGYVVDASRFETDGYRAHSAATRDQAFAKLTLTPVDGAKLNIVANALRQDDTQDPLGVTWATYQRDPRAGEIDNADTQSPKRTLAERYNTRKSIDHKQIGATWEQRFGDDRLHVTAYGGNREVIQYQAFSKAFQAPSTHSGGVVDFERDFSGLDINWSHVTTLAAGKLTTTAGVEYGHSNDARQGYENFVGATFGVKGALRRDEDDTVSNLDPYLQTEWDAGAWQLSAGLRHSRVKISVDDHFLANGNDSGSLDYSHTTPVLGVLYRVAPQLNVYASAARGFETPTLNELFYSGTGGGFNYRLQPALSTHVETGIKARLDERTRINAAVFQVKTSDELVVDTSSGGRTSYRNGGHTLRQGAELSLDATWDYGLSSRVALTTLRAVYDQGSRLPGVPNANAYAELAWKESAGRFGAALEAVAVGKIYAEDNNVDQPAPGYGVLNLRVNASQQWAGWRFRQFVRLNNLLDKNYIGSVIVGDANKRYYEAAPQRNWLLGVSALYQF
ncbi:iron complex outermembrane receptor protein [Duganella sp. 1224]|uniref:TonB-dependent receptor family protein n=1 Tax=Duganella sp. 1224 TaxID=2587052 RepID=UPI00179271FE|nr:TonB-dependent receptor [Duganella sp. 1224]NYE64221.1 iron complex outermembrane receptor protein [Duganella sp. 1224]